MLTIHVHFMFAIEDLGYFIRKLTTVEQVIHLELKVGHRLDLLEMFISFLCNNHIKWSFIILEDELLYLMYLKQSHEKLHNLKGKD